MPHCSRSARKFDFTARAAKTGLGIAGLHLGQNSPFPARPCQCRQKRCNATRGGRRSVKPLFRPVDVLWRTTLTAARAVAMLCRGKPSYSDKETSCPQLVVPPPRPLSRPPGPKPGDCVSSRERWPPSPFSSWRRWCLPIWAASWRDAATGMRHRSRPAILPPRKRKRQKSRQANTALFCTPVICAMPRLCVSLPEKNR